MLQAFFSYFAAPQTCAPGNFFGIPSWYTYLHKAGRISYNSISKACEFKGELIVNGKLDLTTFSLIGLGILDMLLRVAGIVAVAFVIYGGIMYVISQGEPDKTKKAQQTIINALIGVVIVIVSAAVVSFIGNRLG